MNKRPTAATLTLRAARRSRREASQQLAKWTCPHCGNNDRKFILDNGAGSNSRDLTLLCVARVKPEKWSFDHVKAEPQDYDVNGLVPCCMQWDPNDE